MKLFFLPFLMVKGTQRGGGKEVGMKREGRVTSFFRVLLWQLSPCQIRERPCAGGEGEAMPDGEGHRHRGFNILCVFMSAGFSFLLC